MTARSRGWMLASLGSLLLAAGAEAAAQGLYRPVAPLVDRLPGGATARTPAPSHAASRAQVDALLGPLRLVRALSPDTIERLLQEAESLYRSQNHGQALEAFATVLELEPRNVSAWLRLGNLHQQAGRDAEAVDAYERAGRSRARSATDARAQGKALLNIALLGLAQADRAIDAFDDLEALDDPDPEGLRPVRDELLRRLSSVRQRVDRFDVRADEAAGARSDAWEPERRVARERRTGAWEDPDRRRNDRGAHRYDDDPDVDAPIPLRPDPRERSLSAPARRAVAEPEPHRAVGGGAGEPRAYEPYTVDRWTGRSRRAPSAAPIGRALLVDPPADLPLSPARPVDVLRGGPAGRARP